MSTEIPIPPSAFKVAGYKVPVSIPTTSIVSSQLPTTETLMKGITASAGVGRINDIVNAVVASQARASLQPALATLQLGIAANWLNPTTKLASGLLLGFPTFTMPKLTLPSIAMRSLKLAPNVFPQRFANELVASPVFDMQKSILSSVFRSIDFKSLLETWYPRNWPEDVDFEVMRSIASEDGIPVVWVTPTAVIEKLVAAESSNERLAILLDYRDEILESCRAALEEIDAPELYDVKILAQQALESLVAGTFGPAQAMSVTILDSVATELEVNLSNEPAVRKKYLFHSDNITIHEVIYRYAMAPFISFARPWHPSSPLPKPTSLSRHVTIHRTDLEHYNPTNALVAVMLVSSVLRTCMELIAK